MEFNFSAIFDSWQFLLSGLVVTLLLAASVSALSFFLGLLLTVARLYGPNWLSRITIFYIDTMRAIPVLVVLVWVYFALPIATGINLPPFWSALFSLSLHLAAYVAEVMRAGIQSVRPGQIRAGLALGMSQAQVLRKIVLPQAFVRMLPSFGSLLSLAVKDTAIATVIAVPELMRRAEAIAGQKYAPVEAYTTVMILYFIIIFPLTRGVDMLYRRISFLGRS
ncbi:amino acid ABC transporter permease [Ochrobactrum soli]|uniref:Amino acid ABC transporter permease n=1 Tax=Ochrobactrum soli TaxID=2448455 RepID=A0A849KEZ7_9HYPH|nr:amino acid ABC transporter permease [[Ochrobactrum] soli]MCI1000371.1 amino acid ABC transporter permease [Ochrobactrum sp. C6C9]NNU60061.1 amino acid ABC transporter permease [[Ochrobactrum] soli]RLL74435.1 amino acid ABC transporter permease [[Ochrobactrum] soli]